MKFARIFMEDGEILDRMVLFGANNGSDSGINLMFRSLGPGSVRELNSDNIVSIEWFTEENDPETIKAVIQWKELVASLREDNHFGPDVVIDARTVRSYINLLSTMADVHKNP